MLLLFCGLTEVPRAQGDASRRSITWSDLTPLHSQLQAVGLTAASFASYVQRVHETNARRVNEGDLDHLIFYLLQSTRFTTRPPIEPALSAKGFVDSLDERERAAFLRDGQAAPGRLAPAVQQRIRQFVTAIEKPSADARLAFFAGLVRAQFPDVDAREAVLIREYLRAMRFVYEKEFVAQRAERPADAVAGLYRSRGLSTDTAVESGFLVHEGLGIVKALDPDRRIRRVLLVGPGLDLAPRTALSDDRPLESYQPWAVIDALVALGLADLKELQLVAADINPRVVEHLRRATTALPVLTLISEIQPTDTVTISAEYREYFTRLGSAVGETAASPGESAKIMLRKTVRVRPAAAKVLGAERLDIVTERLTRAPFDLAIATNILPYFDDRELMLALANIAAMLAPGGTFVHNESRPALAGITASLGLPVEQSRHAVIATVRGSATPLFDSVWVHRRRGK